MDETHGRPAIAWGHAALLALFVAFIVWYVADTYLASQKIFNLLLIVPVGAAGLAIALMLIVRVLVGIEAMVPRTQLVVDDFRHRYGVPASMASMVVYLVLMKVAGFDVATFLFVAANMWIYGSRNILAILFFPLVFALAVTTAMKHLLFVPVFTLLPL